MLFLWPPRLFAVVKNGMGVSREGSGGWSMGLYSRIQASIFVGATFVSTTPKRGLFWLVRAPLGERICNARAPLPDRA
jgi:hypothetical protein